MSKGDMSCRPASLKFTIDNILNLKQNKESDAHHAKQLTESSNKNYFQRRIEDHGVQSRNETNEKDETNTDCYTASAHAIAVCTEDAIKIINTCPRTDSIDSCGDVAPLGQPPDFLTLLATGALRTQGHPLSPRTMLSKPGGLG
ncbi:hypothetical protein SKAU_G00341630 [Synaphobranchus kaupii]|uniref:Uncharacterized protein n=1 Tax=Synaphobranchus kaupii TaxID=118154 RepID=A0A9Q1EN99_SYNKA|nr:hypothetical protein SKAU_G00341630 [Synaphobranchus kaupii]